jgi:hypothetical protein
MPVPDRIRPTRVRRTPGTTHAGVARQSKFEDLNHSIAMPEPELSNKN